MVVQLMTINELIYPEPSKSDNNNQVLFHGSASIITKVCKEIIDNNNQIQNLTSGSIISSKSGGILMANPDAASYKWYPASMCETKLNPTIPHHVLCRTEMLTRK